MSETFKSSFEEYLLSRIQDSINMHGKNNPAYRRMKERYINFYELADEIIEDLPHSDREIMINLFDMDLALQAEEEVLIYRQGIKDSVSLLQYLRVL